MKIETLAVHAAHQPDPATGAISPPIQLSTTFERAEDGSYPAGFVYGRTKNPNRTMLEGALAELEGGAAAAAFASGLAAIHAVFQSLQAGDHCVVSADIYHGTRYLLQNVMQRWNLEVSFVNFDDSSEARSALRENTRLVYVESPSNPLLKIIDLAEAATLAHDAGAKLVVDNTWATPVLQRPLELGADISVHSSTKYFGGHSDVTGGAVIAKEEDDFFKRIREVQNLAGGVPSPFDCWLVRRGLATLPLRVMAQSRSAQLVAEFLNKHPQVSQVYYPSLPSHPRHEIARRQMTAFGGMLSFQARGGETAARKVAARTQLFHQATSLGGIESLIEHRASVEGPQTTTPRDLLRLSVGIEHADDLIEDLDQALLIENHRVM